MFSRSDSAVRGAKNTMLSTPSVSSDTSAPCVMLAQINEAASRPSAGDEAKEPALEELKDDPLRERVGSLSNRGISIF